MCVLGGKGGGGVCAFACLDFVVDADSWGFKLANNVKLQSDLLLLALYIPSNLESFIVCNE